MKNFKYRIKKLNNWNGLAEVREAECEECIKNNQSMDIWFGDDVMTLTPDELVSKRKTKKWMDGKYTPSGDGYWLWGFEWIPNVDET